MSHARGGVITEQMRIVAEKEGIEPELVRQEVAAGRLTIPANVNHAGLSPIGIGSVASVKINANIGNSALSSDIETELCKLQVSVNFGAHMDLSTGGDIGAIRAASSPRAASPWAQCPSTRWRDPTMGHDRRDLPVRGAPGAAGCRLHDSALASVIRPLSKRVTGIVSRGGGALACGWPTTTAEPHTSARSPLHIRRYDVTLSLGDGSARAASPTPAMRRSSRVANPGELTRRAWEKDAGDHRGRAHPSTRSR
jgi:phosphomethylpyrimidine synthase